MRFTVAFASLLASTATAATINADVNADINARDGAVLARTIDADVDVKANVGGIVKVDADIDVKLDAKVKVALDAAADFKCPSDMDYCPWKKACSCAPGLKLDLDSKKCVGKEITGAWPEPALDVYASVGVKLGTFCAASPTRIVKYDSKHKYCQASRENIVFVAIADIEVELLGLDIDIDIDVNANISADLKATIAGLAGLYVELAAQAVVLFNSDILGLATVHADVDALISLNLGKTVNNLLCSLGLSKCNFDCVSYCTRGCKNYIDVGADVVADIGVGVDAVVGLCILPNVLLIVGKAKVIVTVAVNGLLCLVGGLLKTLLTTFNCHCH